MIYTVFIYLFINRAYSRISLYYLELTANSFNIFVLCQKRVCFFIVKNESFISGLQKNFSKRRKFDVSPTVAIFVKTKQKKNFEKDFKGPQMQLSDLTMKKQILFGQIWKRLKIIVVDLNHYELILMKGPLIKNTFCSSTIQNSTFQGY